MIRYVHLGRWEPRQITVSWVDSSRLIVPEVEQLIDRKWNESTKHAGVNLFDGPMCRLEKVETREKELRLWLSRTSYKPFWGTNLNNVGLAEKYGERILANPLGVSAILLSSDDMLMMGRRNASVAYYPDRVHPFAGCLERRQARCFRRSSPRVAGRIGIRRCRHF